MKKVSLVLVIAIVICSVFDWSCSDLTLELKNVSDGLISLSEKAVDLIEDVKKIDPPDMDTSDVILSHDACYDYYTAEVSGTFIAYHLYSVKIKTKGDYHSCYCIGYELYSSDFFGGSVIHYLVVSDSSSVNSLVGWRFQVTGLWLDSLEDSHTWRSYENLEVSYKTLADIDHDCQIQTEE